MKKFFEGYPPSAHPMAILSAMVSALSTYYPVDNTDDDMAMTSSNKQINCVKLLRRSVCVSL